MLTDAHPLPFQLPDPKRPDLIGLKPGMLKKLKRKQAFLKAVGASQAAAANDIEMMRRRKEGKEAPGAALGSGWAQLGAMLDEQDAGGGKPRGGPGTGQQQMRVRSNNAKQMVATKEVVRLQAVAQHPSFQKNPHAALREHLKATLSRQPQQLQQAQAATPQEAGQQRSGGRAGRKGR